MEENKVKYNKFEKAAHHMEKMLDLRKEAGASEEYLKGYKDAVEYIKYRGKSDRLYFESKSMMENKKHE